MKHASRNPDHFQKYKSGSLLLEGFETFHRIENKDILSANFSAIEIADIALLLEDR